MVATSGNNINQIRYKIRGTHYLLYCPRELGAFSKMFSTGNRYSNRAAIKLFISHT